MRCKRSTRKVGNPPSTYAIKRLGIPRLWLRILSGFPAPNDKDLKPLGLRHDSTLSLISQSSSFFAFPHGDGLEQSMCDHRHDGSAARADQWALVVQPPVWNEGRGAARLALRPRGRPVFYFGHQKLVMPGWEMIALPLLHPLSSCRILYFASRSVPTRAPE